MLYPHKDFEETLVHQCADADKYTTAHKQEIANVRIHDITAYLSVPLRDYKKDGYPIIGHTSVAIDYCPYCGVELEKDERANKTLDLKLL